MWANKADNFLVVHRPYADDPSNTAVDFYARKIKQEGLVGMKTSKEGVRLTFERGPSRYLDPKLGHAPLDVLARQRYYQYGTKRCRLQPRAPCPCAPIARMYSATTGTPPAPP
jgi:hypothetical protein